MSLRRPFLASFLRRRPVYLALGAVGIAFWLKTIADTANSNRAHNPIFRAAMFHIRHHSAAEDALGSDIAYDPKLHPPVKGTINFVQGRADLEFVVQGSRSQGKVHLIAHRAPESDCWIGSTFDVVPVSNNGQALEDRRIEL